MISLKKNLFLILISGIVYAFCMFLFDYFAFNDKVEWIQYGIQGAFFSILFGTLFPIVYYYNYRKQLSQTNEVLPKILYNDENILLKTSAILNHQVGFFWVTNQRVLFLKHHFKNENDIITLNRNEITTTKCFKRNFIFDDGLYVQTSYKSYSFRVNQRDDVMRFLQ